MYINVACMTDNVYIMAVNDFAYKKMIYQGLSMFGNPCWFIHRICEGNCYWSTLI